MAQNKRQVTAERMRANARKSVTLPGTTPEETEDQRKLAHPDYQAMMRGRKDTNRARRRVRRSTKQGQRRH